MGSISKQLLVDRGFRDSVDKAVAKGFVIKIPSFSDTPTSQLTTKQANNSRLITKNRYVVEQVNGVVKNFFSYFGKVIRNTTLSTLFQDFRIACALLNIIFKPAEESQIDEDVANRMLSLQHGENFLSRVVLEERLNLRRSSFQVMNISELDEFRKLSYEELHLFCCGPYQLRMAQSYYAEHIKKKPVTFYLK